MERKFNNAVCWVCKLIKYKFWIFVYWLDSSTFCLKNKYQSMIVETFIVKYLVQNYHFNDFDNIPSSIQPTKCMYKWCKL